MNQGEFLVFVELFVHVIGHDQLRKETNQFISEV
jgi:hypothetical protein